MIPPQIEDIEMTEFSGQALAQAIRRVAVEKRTIGDKGHDALVGNSIRCPANGADVGVIQAVFISGAGFFRVGFPNPGIQCRISDILVIVIGAGLPCRIRRVANNHLDMLLYLSGNTLAVFDRKAR